MDTWSSVWQACSNMDSKNVVFNLFASFIIVLRRFIFLIITPYKTMRKISMYGDYYQTITIFLMVFIYFLFAHMMRGSVIWGGFVYGVFLLLFFITTLFFYLFSHAFGSDMRYMKFIHAFSYTLLPTLIWFITNLILYIVLPPPRTMSFLGKGFSIFFIAYSVSLLVWKLILVYFAIRFSSRLGLYRIIYMFLFYLLIFVPLSLILYYFKLFRVPFI